MAKDLVIQGCCILGHPRADSIRMEGARIAEVGRGLAAGRIVRLSGAYLMPGFNDAHIHFARGAAEASAVDLNGAQSPGEMQRRIRARLPEFRAGEWITGRGWDHTLWPEQSWPTRALFDEVSAVHPMYFSRVDMHVAVANTRALDAAGLLGEAPDPPGGEIARDAAGAPTGLLKETAMALVRSAIPEPDSAARKAAIARALDQAARHGITSLQDNSFWSDFQLYRELEAEGRLTARVTEWLDFNEPLEELEGKRRTASSSLLRTGLVKGFTDGSLGARTAALIEPYCDEPASRGMPRIPPAVLRDQVAALDARGFQIGLHAIGDAAVRLCLDSFEAAFESAAVRRHRIEHAQVVAERDVARLAGLGAIASVQPCHWLTDSRWAAERLGRARLGDAYRWRSFLAAGVPLAFGTDFPVEPMDPRRVLYAATTRDGPERLSMEEAIRCYTAGSAFAEFAEKEKGVIEPGLLADLTALADDPATIHPDRLVGLETVATFVGGVPVFLR